MKKHSFVKKIIWTVLVILFLTIVGAGYESAAESHDAKAFPPAGKMVDVGGYLMHIKCSGVGSPTVVMESGWGGSSSIWGWVQPEIAKTTRVCSYDRAGMGWSEPSTKPRTARQFAKELHTLLAKANEPGPYLLVGHSLGGYTVRVYAHDYPEEVAGVVFVDPQNISITGPVNQSQAPKPGGSSPIVFLARMGVIRMLAGPLGSIEDLPPADKDANTANSVAPRSVQTFLDEGMGISEGAAQARAVTSLGTLPVIVLSRGKGMDAESAASQARYLKLSPNGHHLVAEKSDHGIMVEQPEAVVEAVVKIVAALR